MRSVFHHVALTVRSLDSSVAYYCNVFGFEVVHSHCADGRGVITHLRQPDSSFILELIQGDQNTSITQPAVHLGFACTDISRVEQQLRQYNPGVSLSRTRVGTEHILIVRDEDGYLIELNDGLF